MSQTIISLIIIVLSTLLPKIGLTIANGELTTFVSTFFVIVAAAWVWIRRVQQGDITVAGVRK